MQCTPPPQDPNSTRFKQSELTQTPASPANPLFTPDRQRIRVDRNPCTPDDDDDNIVRISWSPMSPSTGNFLSKPGDIVTKVAVPKNKRRKMCASCGFNKPLRGPHCGEMDPTERKWYCFKCWRGFRQNIYDSCDVNTVSDQCRTCVIYVEPGQGRYMDMGAKPGEDLQLFCRHCWQGWIHSLPDMKRDWINEKAKKPTEVAVNLIEEMAGDAVEQVIETQLLSSGKPDPARPVQKPLSLISDLLGGSRNEFLTTAIEKASPEASPRGTEHMDMDKSPCVETLRAASLMSDFAGRDVTALMQKKLAAVPAGHFEEVDPEEERANIQNRLNQVAAMVETQLSNGVSDSELENEIKEAARLVEQLKLIDDYVPSIPEAMEA